MAFLFRAGIARRLYLLSFVLIAALVLVANAAWVSLTAVDDLARQSLLSQQGATLQQALGAISRNALEARTRVSVMVVAVALGLLAFSRYISQLLLRRIALAQHMAEKVRDGDLTRTLADASRDEFQPLLQALASMQQALMGMVLDVRQGALAVAMASAGIARGNGDLSLRTEDQVLALERTAQSMSELDHMVRGNAEGALQARDLAHKAAGAASNAATVVEQVVDTMRGIDESARSIVQIIAVIDGLAFQTNILALNAAVEAARAGAQGNGFAVVAGEVRVLAQRSAQAAKQIQNLVNTSVARSGQGSALVHRAGNAMLEVATAIGHVTHIVEAISAASQQQSAGLTSVSETVMQLGQSTQQNAALVEEISAAAQGLRSQADAQVQGVAVFQLEGDRY
ncbi:methyl-accepting chemotaxis protein [Rhodoferax lacus]|uniref:Methyl-accepting chemotaxis protein n=1 Tax=Rhodoferax lacus TaxID=2184758 RepID=A0A3E1R885_9BURK|nr:methyl-accepting chemotaxis protein [Rhodoferax lacus]RFO94920.1 methyl-accepting chemotaxis protein [Rhodoferax lacus]